MCVQGGAILIPGLCLPKALQPLLPIFLQVFILTFLYGLYQLVVIVNVHYPLCTNQTMSTQGCIIHISCWSWSCPFTHSILVASSMCIILSHGCTLLTTLMVIIFRSSPSSGPKLSYKTEIEVFEPKMIILDRSACILLFSEK